MLSEFRKSVNYIIYERTTSPLWGAFVFSWLICNWKIVFTVFVVGEGHLNSNKIDYIQDNFIDIWSLIIYPFASTLILIILFPLLGNLAYWITIIYSKWRLDKKNEVEKKQLLSIEQSIALRLSNKQIEENYIKLNSDKETEITSLKLQIEELEKRLNQPTKIIVNNKKAQTKVKPKTEADEWDSDYKNFKTSSLYQFFGDVLVDINNGENVNYYKASVDSLIYYQSLGLIKKANGNTYELTAKGIYFSRIYNKSKFEKEQS